MPYKDKNKAKEAVKRMRERQAGITQTGITSVGITRDNTVGITRDNTVGITGTVTPEGIKSQVPANYGQLDCTCLHCKQAKANKPVLILNHSAYKTADQLDQGEINRVSLPGDVDYTGTTSALQSVSVL